MQPRNRQSDCHRKHIFHWHRHVITSKSQVAVFSQAAFNRLSPRPSIAMTPRPKHPGSSIPAVQSTRKALRSLISSISAKTLHAFLLDNIPAAQTDTLAALASFFAALSPPPLLHCVRCHEDYIDVENGNCSCCVPHDEYDIDVTWIGGHGDTEYETLYFYCGKTVEGEGDRGPPAGWCYEGMHTVSQVKSINCLSPC